MDYERIDELYPYDAYVNGKEGVYWRDKMLRPGDELPVLFYIFGVLGVLKKVPKFDGYMKQLRYLKEEVKPSRKPMGVLDVGAGRGGLITALYLLDVYAEGVEPSFAAVNSVMPRTAACMGLSLEFAMMPIHNRKLEDSLHCIRWDKIDTVVFCESLEHIEEEEFNKCYPKIEEELYKKEGLLILANNHWPIGADGRQHVRTIDDGVYDELSEGKEVLLRKDSHLVLKLKR